MSQERPKDAPDGDVEMKENVDENNVDAGDDAGQDEPHDLYQIISDLSKYLCSVEEK